MALQSNESPPFGRSPESEYPFATGWAKTKCRTGPDQNTEIKWDKALSENNVDALLALYGPDAELESPLVSHLLEKEEGVCRGRAELQRLFEALAPRKPKVRQFYRTTYFTDGWKLMWEYPHQTPNGEQMDFVEVMEIENGLIQKHRVYWGWYGFNVLKRNQYRR